MNRTLRTIIIVIVVVLGAAALVGTGFVFGRSTAWGMMGGDYPGGMMGAYNRNAPNAQFGYEMMSGSGGYGMMGGYDNLENVDPLSVDETRAAVEAYLAPFGNDDLAIKEIMIFDNNAYAIIVEKSSGIGAFELLVDPVTKAVFPEYGPNMMWNLKYGMMSGFGGYGMMGPGMMMGNSGPRSGGTMGNSGVENQAVSSEISAELSVNREDALKAAQSYLDQYSPGLKVSEEITAFYGYYTIDIEKDGAIVGMLSVNGFTRQVFPHTWHGDFIEMSEADHE